MADFGPTALDGTEFVLALRRERALINRERIVEIVKEAVRATGATPLPTTSDETPVEPEGE